MSRGQAFEDWLTAMVCALAAETKEEEYLSMVERHKAGKPEKRGIDVMGQMFGELVREMNTTDADVLGDLFQGAITYGEAGHFIDDEFGTISQKSGLSFRASVRRTEAHPLGGTADFY